LIPQRSYLQYFNIREQRFRTDYRGLQIGSIRAAWPSRLQFCLCLPAKQTSNNQLFVWHSFGVFKRYLLFV